MKRSTSAFALLTVALVLAACGKAPNIQSEDLETQKAMDAAMSQASTGGKTTLSETQQMSIILGKAFPTSDQIVLTSSKSEASKHSSQRGAVQTTLPNGSTWTRAGGSYVAPSGYVGYGGGVSYKNPTTGVTAKGGGIWIPGIGAVAGGLAYNPQTGQYAIGYCYGSAAYGAAACHGCSISGCY